MQTILAAPQRLARFSIVLGLGVLALKAGGWWLTGSAALFSDALESTVNVAAACIALAALRVAERPADSNHTYGHQKAEFFAAVIEGVLIIAAAAAILAHAWDRWQQPTALTAPLQGLALNALATVLNGAWAAVLLRAAKLNRSPTLRADGRHLLADVVTSVGVVAGTALATVAGSPQLDALIAAAVAVYVLWSGYSLISESVGGLMDAAPEPAVVDRIRQVVSESAQGAIEAHDLRMRHAGRQTYMEFHLVVPGDLRVSEAHAICDRIEAALKHDMQHLIVTIHVEPEGKAKHHGVLVL